MEIWKTIEQYPDYSVSNYGRVKSIRFKNEKILRPTQSRGYLYVCIRNKRVINKAVHKLVAKYFLNHNPCGHTLVVNHKDFNRLNNHVDNLEVTTSRQNTNRKHLKLNCSSKYTGVSLHKPNGKWRACIRINGINTHLGLFINEYDAHLAYENALDKITNLKHL